MTALEIFRSSFVESLRASVAHNLDRYCNDEAWVRDLGGFQSKQLATGVELADSLELLAPNDGHRDVENAMRLHRALPHLTPLQARDPRLWCRLAHVELWEYMRLRWPIDRYLTDRAKAQRFVESRYFVQQTEGRAVLRNGVARLWWTARLSHDSNRENPYELTSALLSTLDITQQILERSLGRAPVIVKAFLEFLVRNRDLLLSGGEEARGHIRHLAKYLNVYGGLCVLDYLSEGDIIAALDTELLRRVSSRRDSQDPERDDGEVVADPP